MSQKVKGKCADVNMATRGRFIFMVFACLVSMLGLVVKGEARTIRVAIPTVSLSMTAFFVAKDKGYYQEEGLDVQLIQMRSALTIQSMIARGVEFSTVPVGGLNAAMRGAPLRNLYNTFYRPMWSVFSKPEIRDVKALRGKKIGVSGLADSPYIMLQEILTKHGLEAGRDVVTIVMGDAPARLVALVSGSVDAVALVVPWNFKAEEAGFRELISFIKEDLVLVGGGVVVHDDLLTADPYMVEKFLRATLKGHIYARENRTGTIPILARNIKVSEEEIAKSYDIARTAMSRDGTISEEAQKKQIQLLMKTMKIQEMPSHRNLFNFALTKKTYAELQSTGWKPGP